MDSVAGPLDDTQWRRIVASESLEDQEVQRMEESGDMTQIAGSQSMLTQELAYEDFSQPEPSANARSVAVQYGILTQDDNDDANIPLPSSQDSFLRDVDDSFTGAAALEDEDADDEVDVSRPAKRIKANVDKENESEAQKSPGRPRASSTTSSGFGSLLEAVHDAVQQEFQASRCSPRIAKRRLQQQLERGEPADESAQSELFDPAVDPSVAMAPLLLPKKMVAKKKTSSSVKKSQPKAASKPNIKSHPILTLPVQSQPTLTSPRQVMAQRAADLAIRASEDEHLAKRLLLKMALVRDSCQKAPQLPGKGHVIPDGFVWTHYPPLEVILRNNMKKYFDLSMSKCQSTVQHQFNNELVVRVRDAARALGWSFSSSYQDDKGLRDRIRCYYKTHIQNAKKRLRTMLRNPTKKCNAKNLSEHYGLIQDTMQQQQKLLQQQQATKEQAASEKSPKKPTPRRVTVSSKVS